MVGTASIHSIAGEDGARAESAAWARFAAPGDSGEFCASWLAILCAQVDRVNGALLLLRSEEAGAYAAAAVWPDAGRAMHYLGPAAERTLREGRGIAVASDGVSPPSAEQPAYVGYPVQVGGALYGAVVLDLEPRADGELQRALRLVHWGIAWLTDHFRQHFLAEQEGRLARLSLVADLVATAVEERRFGPAALAVANELAARLRCDRASIGIETAGSIEVQAISHTANFDHKSDLVRFIGEAMDEVLDLDVAIVYPPPESDELGALAHTELARECRDVAICSVPLLDGGVTGGVLTLERTAGEPYDAAEIELAKTIGLLLGPILALKRNNEKGIWARTRDIAGSGVTALFGPRHPGVKLLAVLAAVLVLFFSVVTGDYRVSAKTVIEGALQRAAVAPFEGYVAESLVRAGDTVSKGQVLCRLEDKDLRLEQTRWTSEREQLLRKHRQAFASADRAAMAVLAAQISQAEAQLALAEEKLARATLVAPFDGIVVSGDLSQLLGTPVEQGKLLFEIAPLDAYRVVLQVDERDIADLALGQEGKLVLSGIANEVTPFAVKQITSVSTPADGRNYFRVEAHIDQPSARLRPGMEGVGKVSVGERRLIWIWTHSLVDWLRLWAWNWLP
ncbi:MAG: efflux RND transporter periplasmic adaptor subunit [Rhodocyclaceae bacterium]|nr:efflux RND transporter periplasmic adaptor subunit [Rhodocyclaceae bacterium]